MTHGPIRPGALVGALFALGLPSAAFILVLSGAVRGGLTTAVASVLGPITFMASVSGGWHGLRVLGYASEARPLLARHGFWLVLLLTLLGLPLLGGFGLIDPWESHYAEVAREMLERNDFISTWWAQERWFMSKPVLTFWLEAMSMRVLGVVSVPGQVLSGLPGPFAHPEWAIRIPGMLCMLIGCYSLYRGVAAGAGRVAGLFAGLVLATAAQWTLAARQALTDASFVGALTTAFGLLLLAWNTSEDERLLRRQIDMGRLRVSFDASWFMAALVLVAVGSQLLLLLSSQVGLRLLPPALQFIPDTLEAGSPGNCALPGQPRCASVPLAHAWLSPGLQAVGWGVPLALLVSSMLHERRVRHLWLLGAWFALGLASMSKGAAGFALPLAVAGAYLILHGRWRELGQSELLRGGSLVVLLVAPWYVAMYARHGRVIFDELVLRHMLGRALDHLHDTNAGECVGFRYYVWQLGYALFPWIGLLPAALFSAVNTRAGRPESVQRVVDVGLLWALVTFALFTSMGTKFHHYILPALPAFAVLVGVDLGERWREPREAVERAGASSAVVGISGALLALLVGMDLLLPVRAGMPGAARFQHLLSYQYQRAWPAELDFTRPIAAFVGACVLVSLCLGVARWRRVSIVLQLCIGGAFAGWLAHHYLHELATPFGQRQVIEAFYRDRSSAAEPLIAYQLNWKGENFYTGNHLAIFVTSGKPFRRYLDQQRSAGQSVFHFVLETERLARLRAELRSVTAFSVLTDRRASDKICLVRVELPVGPT
jgi:4-amino-4-deoxy-L-arabinose transferase-like glycosyltransferase